MSGSYYFVYNFYTDFAQLFFRLPRKTDMERKIEIYKFSARTRQLFVRLLALVKWASSATKVDRSAHIMAFLDKQALLFVETADVLARVARETLVHARCIAIKTIVNQYYIHIKKAINSQDR